MTKLPFDLDLWKTGKYDVVTRDGTEAKIVYVEEDNLISHPILVIDKINKNSLEPWSCEINGKSICDESRVCDIFLILKKKKLFIAVDKKSLTSSEQVTEKGCKFHVTTNAYESIRDLPPLTHRQIIEIEIEDLE